MLFGCTIYTVPHQRFQLSSLRISPLGFFFSRSPIISTFSIISPARDPMLFGCTIYTVPHQRFQLSSLRISPLGFFSPGRSKLPQSMLYGRTTHAVPDIGSSLRPFAFWQLDHHPAPSAFISPGPSSARRPDALPSESAPDHDLPFQSPPPHP